MNRFGRWWPFVALWVPLLVVLGPSLAAGKILAYGDALVQDFPLRLVAVTAWLHGIVPFWNPFSFGGMPLLATIHVGVFFPGNWTFFFLDPVPAMNLAVLLAFWTAGASAYVLARANELSRMAALVAGLVFMGSGFMVAHMENLQILQAAALMPAILWAIARHAKTGEARFARWFAVLLGLQVLAGHPQMTIFTGLVAAPYGFWLARGTARPRARLAALAAGAACGLGLAALQLLPTLDFIPLTQRAEIPLDQLSFRSLPVRQLITFWFPFAFGLPHGTPAYWGAPTFTDVFGYAGLVSLVLGVVGLAHAETRRRAGFWAAVALVAGLLALGDSTRLIQLVAALPVLRTLPAPGRHLLEVDLALAMLAGFGLDALRATPGWRRPLAAWLVTGLPVVAVAGYVALQGPALAARLQPFMPPEVLLAGTFDLARPAFFVPLVLWLALVVPLAAAARAPVAARAMLMGLLALDLAIAALGMPWYTRCPALPTPLMPPSGELTKDEGRIFPVSSAFVYPYEDLESIRALRYPDWGALAGVRAVTGYDAFVPARYALLMGGMRSTGQVSSPDVWLPRHHGPDVLGMRYVLLDPTMARTPVWAQFARQRGLVTTSAQLDATWLFNPRALPRAWRLARVESLPAGAVNVHVMRDAAFDPARLGYLDAPAAAPTGLAPGSARARTPDFNHLVVETEGSGPGMLAVSEAYNPGWRAFSGATELPVSRLDGLILGVAVPAGAQRVELRYEPPRWRLGLASSALAALALLAWALWERRSKTRTQGPM